MKKRYFLLSALAAAAVMPGTASANLVLDMPPILAGNGNSPPKTCSSAAECGSGYSCCGSKCYSSSTGFCCEDTWQTTGYCCGGTWYNDGGFCCGDQHYTSGYCCNGTYGPDPCSSSATGKLNDTGITNNIASVAGDDAEYGRDADPATNGDVDGYAGFSFTKIVNGETCIQDTVTGLTWSPDQGVMSFAAAQTFVAGNPTICGQTGWRIPTIKELVSIVSYHKTSPAIDNDATRGFFTDTQSATYWTSTPNAASSTTKAWVVNFVNGNADNTILKSSSLRLRLVRP